MEVSATESPVDRLARLYSLRKRLELEIAAAEALLAGQPGSSRLLRIRYDATRDRAGRRKVAICGTDSGYHRHLRRLKEPACEACKIAHSEAEKGRAARARESVA